eukprot:snap_masked-scaffold_18-processed-gene-6.23-mRNA-1 protein AED:1.00 eAED:1.00 QI:0/-1/0/0/-1/1/1/0/1143
MRTGILFRNLGSNSNKGYTELQKSIYREDIEDVSFLLKSTDVNLYEKDKWGNTAFDWANRVGSKCIRDIFFFLLTEKIEGERLDEAEHNTLLKKHEELEKYFHAHVNIRKNFMLLLQDSFQSQASSMDLKKLFYGISNCHFKRSFNEKKNEFMSTCKLLQVEAPNVSHFLDINISNFTESNKFPNNLSLWCCIYGDCSFLKNIVLIEKGCESSLSRFDLRFQHTVYTYISACNMTQYVLMLLKEDFLNNIEFGFFVFATAKTKPMVIKSVFIECILNSCTESFELLSKHYISKYGYHQLYIALSTKVEKTLSPIEFYKLGKVKCDKMKIIIFSVLNQIETLELNEAKRKDNLLRYFCRKGCGKSLTLSEFEAHEKYDCSFRKIFCTLGCGKYLKYNFHDSHQRKHCPKRKAYCPNVLKGCSYKGKVESMKVHIKKHCIQKKGFKCNKRTVDVLDCPFVGIQGSYTCIYCRKDYTVQKLLPSVHEIVCNSKLRKCPMSCGKPISKANWRHHISEDCLNRVIDCELCGMKLKYIDLNEHNKLCCNRKVLCPYEVCLSKTKVRVDGYSGIFIIRNLECTSPKIIEVTLVCLDGTQILQWNLHEMRNINLIDSISSKVSCGLICFSQLHLHFEKCLCKKILLEKPKKTSNNKKYLEVERSVRKTLTLNKFLLEPKVQKEQNISTSKSLKKSINTNIQDLTPKVAIGKTPKSLKSYAVMHQNRISETSFGETSISQKLPSLLLDEENQDFTSLDVREKIEYSEKGLLLQSCCFRKQDRKKYVIYLLTTAKEGVIQRKLSVVRDILSRFQLDVKLVQEAYQLIRRLDDDRSLEATSLRKKISVHKALLNILISPSLSDQLVESLYEKVRFYLDIVIIDLGWLGFNKKEFNSYLSRFEPDSENLKWMTEVFAAENLFCSVFMDLVLNRVKVVKTKLTWYEVPVDEDLCRTVDIIEDENAEIIVLDRKKKTSIERENIIGQDYNSTYQEIRMLREKLEKKKIDKPVVKLKKGERMSSYSKLFEEYEKNTKVLSLLLEKYQRRIFSLSEIYRKQKNKTKSVSNLISGIHRLKELKEEENYKQALKNKREEYRRRVNIILRKKTALGYSILNMAKLKTEMHQSSAIYKFIKTIANAEDSNNQKLSCFPFVSMS